MAERSLVLRIEVINDGGSALNQYNQALKSAATNNQQLQGGIQNLNQQFGDFNRMLHTTVLGFSAMEVLKTVGEFRQLGESANIASATFEAFADGAHTANATDQDDWI